MRTKHFNTLVWVGAEDIINLQFYRENLKSSQSWKRSKLDRICIRLKITRRFLSSFVTKRQEEGNLVLGWQLHDAIRNPGLPLFPLCLS